MGRVDINPPVPPVLQNETYRDFMRWIWDSLGLVPTPVFTA